MRTFIYQHAGDLEGTPSKVGRAAAKDLEEAGAIFARQVEATVRQARSAFLSDRLREHPELTPADLAEEWDDSPEAKACVVLMRAARASNGAVKMLRKAQREHM